MARGDKTKKPAFEMWQQGKTLEEITRTIKRNSTTKASSVSGWVSDWERGSQNTYTPKIRKDK